MDRFLMKVVIDYPTDADEVSILRLVRGEDAGTGPKDEAKVPQQAVLDARAEVIKPVHAAKVGHSAFNGSSEADDAAWTRGRLRGMQLPANHRAHTVGPHEHISLDAASVPQVQRHTLAVYGEAGRFTSRRHRVGADDVQ